MTESIVKGIACHVRDFAHFAAQDDALGQDHIGDVGKELSKGVPGNIDQLPCERRACFGESEHLGGGDVPTQQEGGAT